MGSYQLELVAPDRPAVRYPVELRRRQGWDGRRPGADAPTPVALPADGAVGPDERYVAAGWFEAGGDDDAPGALPATRVWLDAFVMQASPVTMRALAAFLADPAGASFRAATMRDGLELWRPDWPAVGVSWDAAVAYARWWAERSGQPWRLPTELEWEKAARGPDGRRFPWGDFVDAAFTHVRGPDRAPPSPASVTSHPTDESPYGVRGLAGNVRDWCADGFAPGGPAIVDGLAVVTGAAGEAKDRVVRGGSWRQPLDGARAAARVGLAGARGFPDVGLRLVRSTP